MNDCTSLSGKSIQFLDQEYYWSMGKKHLILYEEKAHLLCLAAERFAPEIRQYKAIMDALAGSPLFHRPVDYVLTNGEVNGFILENVPENLVDFDLFMRGSTRFASQKAVCLAGAQLAKAMRDLHRAGMCFFSLSPYDLRISPKNGALLVSTEDSQIIISGTLPQVMGRYEYQAPEIVRGDSTPNPYSDRYLLSLHLFLMFTGYHPLQGKRYLAVPCLTPAAELQLFGTNPIFLLDPEDDRNGPVQSIHRNLTEVWSALPACLQDAFIREFSQDVLLHPEKRRTEKQWYDLLRECFEDLK